jgi:Zn-dependent protease
MSDPSAGRFGGRYHRPDRGDAGGTRRRAAGGGALQRWRDPQVLIAVGLILVAVYGLRSVVSSTTIIVLAVVIPSIILHEIAHGVVALWCGDDTAQRAGRLTLNPLRHIDPIGTLVLPALLALSGIGAFGYAKPVPINPMRMRHPRNDAVLVSLAGPATNLILAGGSIVLLRTFERVPMLRALDLGIASVGVGVQLLFYLGLINVTLTVFNALPIPPLDGSILVERVLPRSALPAWWQIRRYAMVVLLLVVLLDRNVLFTRVFIPAQNAWIRVLVS